MLCPQIWEKSGSRGVEEFCWCYLGFFSIPWDGPDNQLLIVEMVYCRKRHSGLGLVSITKVGNAITSLVGEGPKLPGETMGIASRGPLLQCLLLDNRCCFAGLPFIHLKKKKQPKPGKHPEFKNAFKTLG